MSIHANFFYFFVGSKAKGENRIGDGQGLSRVGSKAYLRR